MLNKNEAPEGFEAVEYVETITSFHCENCAMTDMNNFECLQNPCHELSREDKTNVYFVRCSPVMSKLLHPMGSLGEDV